MSHFKGESSSSDPDPNPNPNPNATDVQWRRPQEFLGPSADIKIFDGKIEFNDIKQV